MTKKRMLITLLCLLLSAMFAPVPDAFADYYKYTDSRGVVNMTNKLESVPVKYRSTMKVVREEAPRKDPAAGQPQQPASAPAEIAASEQAPAAASEQASDGKFAQLSARFVWFKPLVYAAAVLALFIAITKVTSLLPSPQLAKAIYLAFFLGVFVFLYKSYATHVVESSLKIKEKAVSMMKKSNVREQPEVSGETSAPSPR